MPECLAATQNDCLAESFHSKHLLDTLGLLLSVSAPKKLSARFFLYSVFKCPKKLAFRKGGRELEMLLVLLSRF